MTHPGRRKGFTIVELLVVICIIMILAGILLSSLKAVWGTGERAQVQGVMDSIVAGIEKYREVNGCYPMADSTNTFMVTDKTATGTTVTVTYKFLTTNLYSALCTSAEGGPFCTISEKYIQTTDNVASQPMTYFVDCWGLDGKKHPLTYIPAEFYKIYMRTGNTGTVNAGGSLSGGTTGMYYNFTSYQLRSLGKDFTDNDGSGDDLQNFAR